MNILFLGPPSAEFCAALKQNGDSVTNTELPINREWVVGQKFDFLVSYGYRHILRRDILELFPNRAINLHISYLPWNRGSDPNPWSFIENTKKGVTIHYLDEGVDTGDIIAQQELFFSDSETLAETYSKLQNAIRELFSANWEAIRSGECPRQRQQGKGSFHFSKEAVFFEPVLRAAGWNTNVSKLVEFGKTHYQRQSPEQGITYRKK